MKNFLSSLFFLLYSSFALGSAFLENYVTGDSQKQITEKELFAFAKEGNIYAIQSLIDLKVDFNAKKNSKGSRLIHSLASRGLRKEIKFLVESEPEIFIDIKNNNGIRPIHLAALEGHVETIKLLVAYGANVNAQANNGYMPIHAAAKSGHVDAIHALVVLGADVSSQANNGFNPLHIAAQSGDETVARYLVKQRKSQLKVILPDGDVLNAITIARQHQHDSLANYFERISDSHTHAIVFSSLEFLVDERKTHAVEKSFYCETPSRIELARLHQISVGKENKNDLSLAEDPILTRLILRVSHQLTRQTDFPEPPCLLISYLDNQWLKYFKRSMKKFEDKYDGLNLDVKFILLNIARFLGYNKNLTS